MSIGEIAGVTRIPVRSLECLESGQFEKLPADVFVRGFLRSYARCVGLDAEDAIRRYTRCGMTPAPVASPLADELANSMATLDEHTYSAGVRRVTAPRAATQDAQDASPSEPDPRAADRPEPEPTRPAAELSGARDPEPAAEATKEASIQTAAPEAAPEAKPASKPEAKPASKIDTIEVAQEARSTSAAGSAAAAASDSARGRRASSSSKRRKRRRKRRQRGAGSKQEPNSTRHSASAPVETPSTSAAPPAAAQVTTEPAPPATDAASAAHDTPAATTRLAEGASDARRVESHEDHEGRGSDEAQVRDEGVAAAATVGEADEPAGTTSSEETLPAGEPVAAAPEPIRLPAQPEDAAGEALISAGEEAEAGAPKHRGAQRAARAQQSQRPALVIDDDSPEDAERIQEERAERTDTSWRSFLPPALLDNDEGSHRGALTLAVIILVIVATLTMSYLLRRPSGSGDGITQEQVGARAPAARA